MREKKCGIDTEVCEQTFSWLSKYEKMTRKMNRGHCVFFMIYVQHLRNLTEEEKLRNMQQYPNFVRLFHTSTPLRSEELSKK
ncbi:unnamed protein product [Porites evermanni]|uniref:Uncharacterized protein n=1 Tax=Porites evermanni TaxID=104178 RepID=A0ABN8PAS5_9CNID|nr:unnamed protein product [Porites evermanni]